MSDPTADWYQAMVALSACSSDGIISDPAPAIIGIGAVLPSSDLNLSYVRLLMYGYDFFLWAEVDFHTQIMRYYIQISYPESVAEVPLDFIHDD